MYTQVCLPTKFPVCLKHFESRLALLFEATLHPLGGPERLQKIVRQVARRLVLTAALPSAQWLGGHRELRGAAAEVMACPDPSVSPWLKQRPSPVAIRSVP